MKQIDRCTNCTAASWQILGDGNKKCDSCYKIVPLKGLVANPPLKGVAALPNGGGMFTAEECKNPLPQGRGK